MNLRGSMIRTYSLKNAYEWDAIVKSFSNYDVYYLSGYVKAFEINGDGKAVLIYYTDKATRAVNVVMKRDISDFKMLSSVLAQGELYDIVTPYGYGGWLIEGENIKGLFQSYENWCRQERIVSEFIRFHPMLENHIALEGVYEIKGLGETVAMELASPDHIWNNLTSKNRNVIRKAIKNGVKIYNGRYPEIYEKFRVIYNSTMDKDSADSYYYFKKDFYESILEELSQNAQVFYAQLPDGKVIASSIMIGANQYMNYHLSGFVQEYGTLAATNLLIYEAALWGCANGYRTLYLGGGVGSYEDSLFKFKKAFYKGNLHRFYVGKKIFDEQAYSRLVEVRRQGKMFDENKTFFPLYRG